MPKRTPALSSLLRNLLDDPRYGAVEQVAEQLIQEWSMPKSSRKRSTQFDTLWEVCTDEGRIDGIKILLNTLRQFAEDND